MTKTTATLIGFTAVLAVLLGWRLRRALRRPGAALQPDIATS